MNDKIILEYGQEGEFIKNFAFGRLPKVLDVVSDFSKSLSFPDEEADELVYYFNNFKNIFCRKRVVRTVCTLKRQSINMLLETNAVI